MTVTGIPSPEQQAVLLGQLAGEILRELTDPVTAILAHAEILCEPGTPERAFRDCAGSILQEALRCRRILAISAALGGGRRLDPRPVDLEALAADVALVVAARRRPEDPRVRFTSQGGTAWVSGDRAVLAEVIASLVEASVEERRVLGDGGEVEVSCQGVDGRAEVVITHDHSRRSADLPVAPESLLGRLAGRILALHGGRLEVRGDRELGMRIFMALRGMEPAVRVLAAPRKGPAPRPPGAGTDPVPTPGG